MTGGNYKRWKEDVELALTMMDVDMAIRVEKPTDLTTESTVEQKAYFEKWDRANRLALMLMKRSMFEG